MAVHYIQPYSIVKNIGGAINMAIESLVTSDDDWIVLLDHDMLFLRPDSKFQLEEVLMTTDFHILSCLTNRLANRDLLSPSMFDKTDMLDHIKTADAYHNTFYGKVEPTRSNLAAFMLCFRVGTWKMLGRFQENTISFDSRFCIRAKNMRMRLGLMIGIYAFHLYRMGQPGEAKNNFQHLLPENN